MSKLEHRIKLRITTNACNFVGIFSVLFLLTLRTVSVLFLVIFWHVFTRCVYAFHSFTQNRVLGPILLSCIHEHVLRRVQSSGIQHQ
jgi:hypothetical protein